jgi:hypothetical protein
VPALPPSLSQSPPSSPAATGRPLSESVQRTTQPGERAAAAQGVERWVASGEGRGRVVFMEARDRPGPRLAWPV